MTDLVGIAVIDKPDGPTSHGIVSQVRRHLGLKKVGHSGTLDPGATGVLLVGVGRATRLLRFLTDLPKSYSGLIMLGTETDSLDHQGEVTATHDMGTVEPEAVSAAAQRFLGDIEQIPPMVSAIKIDGKRLHALAREGKEVERPPRPVTIHEISTEPTDDPLVYRLDVRCSSGTYVRTLAADIGAALGGGAHLANLRRTAIGSFGVDRATAVEDLVLMSPAEAMADYEAITVDAETATNIGYGRKLDPQIVEGHGPGPWAMLDGAGTLVAMYERESPDQPIRAAVVIVPA